MTNDVWISLCIMLILVVTFYKRASLLPHLEAKLPDGFRDMPEIAWFYFAICVPGLWVYHLISHQSWLILWVALAFPPISVLVMIPIAYVLCTTMWLLYLGCNRVTKVVEAKRRKT